MKRNIAQQECIETVEGQVIVIACPGAGKTTTLLGRIHHMVKEKNINPNQILMMTFTRAAAAEMKKRYETEPGSGTGVTFCTIHALCLSILTRYLGKPELINEEEEKDFFYQMFRTCRSGTPDFYIPAEYRNQILGISDIDQFISDLILDISVHKNNPGREFPLNSCNDRMLFQFFDMQYESYKKQNGKIDFDDMLTRTYTLLLNNPRILQDLKNKFRYIQVDEYQDTNYIQRDIIYLIAGKDGNLAVVGDDDQSIYGFRGAQPEIMLGFPKDYPHAKIIHMGINYRSAQTIVNCSGRMIEKNRNRFEKQFTAAKQEKGELELTVSDTKDEELQELADRISMLRSDGVPDEQIAVLYRTNKEAESIACELARLGIPFHVADGITNRYEHWIWKDIFSYYKLANNIGEKNDLVRILNHPQRFLNRPEYLDYEDKTEEGFFKISDKNEKQMKMVAYGETHEFWKIKSTVKEIEKLYRILRSLKGKNPRDFLCTLFMKYKKYLEEYSEFRGVDYEELESIWNSYLRDIAHLSVNKVCTWKEWENYKRRYEHCIQQARKSQNGVLLSSMHKSKGLEWDYVFIANCVNGTVPYFNEKHDCNMEEERRLFYVACTRAKKHLEFMSYKRKGNKKTVLCPFISEMTKR